MNVYYVLLTLCCMPSIARAQSIFDDGAVASPYKKVLDLTMHVAQDIDLLQQHVLLNHEHVLLEDALAGRITRLWALCKELCGTRTSDCMSDDLEYLATVTKINEHKYATLQLKSEFVVARLLFKKVAMLLDNLIN